MEAPQPDAVPAPDAIVRKVRAPTPKGRSRNPHQEQISVGQIWGGKCEDTFFLATRFVFLKPVPLCRLALAISEHRDLLVLGGRISLLPPGAVPEVTQWAVLITRGGLRLMDQVSSHVELVCRWRRMRRAPIAAPPRRT